MSFLWKSPSRSLLAEEVEIACFQRNVCEPSSPVLLAENINIWIWQFFILIHQTWKNAFSCQITDNYQFLLFSTLAIASQKPGKELAFGPVWILTLALKRVIEYKSDTLFFVKFSLLLDLAYCKVAIRLSSYEYKSNPCELCLGKMANAQYQILYLFHGHLY